MADPAVAIAAFTERRSFLLPPTWSQLDAVSSAGASVAEVLGVARSIAPIMPILTEQDGRWFVQFDDVDRYEAARQGAVEIPEVTGPELS